ncbi:MAG: hypothetical protein WCD37_07445 [Chloroflexia bacterium]
MERIFISTTGGGISRAACDGNGSWHVESLLRDQRVVCLTADPLNAGRVYAGTQGNGVLRSDDAGKTWRACGLTGHIIKAIAASRTQPGVLYAGTKPVFVFKSNDGGVTWREMRSFRRIPWRWLWLSPAEKPFIGYVQAIATSPTAPGHIAVGIEAGAVVMTTDGGKTWSRHCRGALRDCHSLIFHARDGSRLYEGGGTGGGAAFSTDGGRHWTKPRKGLDRHYGWAVAANPIRPDIWYVSLSPGPFKAHGDGNAQAYIFRREGNGWRKLTGGLPQPLDHMPYALLTDPNAPDLLYAGLSNGDIWESIDCGNNWRKLPLNLGGIHSTLVMLP